MPQVRKVRPICAAAHCARPVRRIRNRYCGHSCAMRSRTDLSEIGRKGGKAGWAQLSGGKWQALVRRRRDVLDALVPQQGYFSRLEVKALVNRGISLGYQNGWKARSMRDRKELRRTA